MPKFIRNKKIKLNESTIERTPTKYYNINEVSTLFCCIFYTYNANINR